MPDSKKPLHGNAPANMPSTYRALVFALDNVDPIRDGKLYCCEYELTGGGDACCPVRFERLGASDPVGNALTTNGKPEKLCLATGATAAGAAPAAPRTGGCARRERRRAVGVDSADRRCRGDRRDPAAARTLAVAAAQRQVR